MTITQKLLDQINSNFKIGSFNEFGTFGDKMKPIQTKGRGVFWILCDLAWNDPINI